ncbi:MAG: elongation factor G, partial [Planctomycetota bacterium]
CFIKAVADGNLVPIIFTSIEQGVGAGGVLDAIEDLFPSAGHAHTVTVWKDADCSGESKERPLNADEPFLGQIFKLTVDKHVGKISYMRVYSGSLHNGDYFYHAEGGRKEKIGHICTPMGKELIAQDSGVAGEIVALTKIDSLEIGHTISAHEDCGFLMNIPFPKPMAEVAVRPKSRADETKISEALHKLCDEIPTFKIMHRASTNETIASGMSALHLETTFKRMKDRYGIEVETAPAKVPYHETITCAADGHCRHKKQSGGRGQFGEVFLRIEPAEEGVGLDFQWNVVGGSIPTNFATAIEKGIREKMIHGVIAGHPLNDVRVFINDGKYHDVDSSEAAFKIAGAKAFADAVSKARPALLEPIVEAEITVPSEHMGDVSGDLSTRRGRIQGMDAKGVMQIIIARVPRAEMSEYPRVITALTHGEGSFSYEEAGYEQVPANIQKQIMDAFKPREEED